MHQEQKTVNTKYLTKKNKIKYQQQRSTNKM